MNTYETGGANLFERWTRHRIAPYAFQAFYSRSPNPDSVAAAWALGPPPRPPLRWHLSHFFGLNSSNSRAKRIHGCCSSIRTFPTCRKRRQSATIVQLLSPPTSPLQLQDPLVARTHRIAPPVCRIKRVVEHYPTVADETNRSYRWKHRPLIRPRNGFRSLRMEQRNPPLP